MKPISGEDSAAALPQEECPRAGAYCLLLERGRLEGADPELRHAARSRLLSAPGAATAKWRTRARAASPPSP